MAFKGYKFRMYCETESKQKFVLQESETPPTECPEDSGHTIREGSIALVDKSGDDDPKQSDGKRFFTPDLFPIGDKAVFPGVADNVASGVRWGGERFRSVISAEGDDVQEFQYIDSIHLAGGIVNRLNGDIDDYVTYELYAPATVGENNPGLGQFNKYEIPNMPGLHIYVPDPEWTGDWDIDLEEKLNENVAFTKANPVRNEDKTGWFDYDIDTNILQVNGDHAGGYDLYDFPAPLTNHMPKMGIMGNGDRELIIPALKVADVLPHWKHKVTIHHGPGTHELKVQWILAMGRKKTT